MSTITGQHSFLKAYQSDWSARPVLNDAEIRQLESDVTATLSDPAMAFVLTDSVKVSAIGSEKQPSPFLACFSLVFRRPRPFIQCACGFPRLN
jgi:hypothetical protein